MEKTEQIRQDPYDSKGYTHTRKAPGSDEVKNCNRLPVPDQNVITATKSFSNILKLDMRWLFKPVSSRLLLFLGWFAAKTWSHKHQATESDTRKRHKDVRVGNQESETKNQEHRIGHQRNRSPGYLTRLPGSGRGIGRYESVDTNRSIRIGRQESSPGQGMQIQLVQKPNTTNPNRSPGDAKRREERRQQPKTKPTQISMRGGEKEPGRNQTKRTLPVGTSRYSPCWTWPDTACLVFAYAPHAPHAPRSRCLGRWNAPTSARNTRLFKNVQN